ncbi:MAG: hypothetical protein ACOX43_05785 [Bacilli bacterium]
MKKKRFFPLNFVWQMLTFLFLVLSIIGLYILICAFIESDFVVVFMLLFPVLFCLYTFIRFEHNRIVLNEKYIFMPDDWLSWKEKIQYKVTIYYDEITDINLVKTHTNSSGKRIKRAPIIPLTFLEFKCSDGSYKRIFILYFTKKQRIKIINEIKKRMKAVGNYAAINETEKLLDGIVDK